jgi:hypothetical protein
VKTPTILDGYPNEFTARRQAAAELLAPLAKTSADQGAVDRWRSANATWTDKATLERLADSEQLSAAERRLVAETLKSELFVPFSDPLPEHDPADLRQLAELAAAEAALALVERQDLDARLIAEARVRASKTDRDRTAALGELREAEDRHQRSEQSWIGAARAVAKQERMMRRRQRSLAAAVAHT